jgi:hypothetical protein
MIEHAVNLSIGRPATDVFGFLEEVGNAPKWLGRCVELKKTGGAATGVGTKLSYAYKDGSRSGTMDGQITEYQPHERLAFLYSDKMMEVAVGFRLSSSGQDTQVDHWVRITPKNFLMKLMSPMIRAATKKQMATDTAKLKALLEER